MKNSFVQKIVAALLVMTFLAPAALPQKAHAVLGVGDSVIEVGPQLGFVTTIAANTTALVANSALQVTKSFTLDTIATALAKVVIRQITASVVNWINSGFQGSPSFVTNPQGFLLDTADQFTGVFLANAGPLAQGLCSNFSVNVRLALAFKYHPQAGRYTCTLGTIIKNAGNASFTLNGFTAGDFRQGGWPAFVTLTTQPQNNPNGAYLQADDELSITVANQQILNTKDASNGHGFLSFQDPSCVKAANTALSAAQNAPHPIGPVAPSNGGQTTAQQNVMAEDEPGGQGAAPNTNAASCPILTPGSVIANATDASVMGPQVELQLVDSINQIVSALAVQLITTVIGATGLAGSSGSSPSDPNSYINQMQNEEATQNAAVQSAISGLIKSMATYIGNATQYKTNRDQSLATMTTAQNAYTAVETCYQTKISSSTPPLLPADIATAESQINAVGVILTSQVNPLVTTLLSNAQSATSDLETLTNIEQQANSASDLDTINTASQEYTSLVQNNQVVSAQDVTTSAQDLSDAQTKAGSFESDAGQRLQACQIFPPDQVITTH